MSLKNIWRLRFFINRYAPSEKKKRYMNNKLDEIEQEFERMSRCSYLLFDRLFFLMNTDCIEMKSYCSKYEVSRSTFFRDLQHLKLFYNINFEYDEWNNRYIKAEA